MLSAGSAACSSSAPAPAAGRAPRRRAAAVACRAADANGNGNGDGDGPAPLMVRTLRGEGEIVVCGWLGCGQAASARASSPSLPRCPSVPDSRAPRITAISKYKTTRQSQTEKHQRKQ